VSYTHTSLRKAGLLVLLSLLSCWLAVSAQTTCEIRAANAAVAPGQSLSIAIELVAQGDENALAFTLNFNPGVLSYQSASLGSAATGANFIVNPNFAANGRIGVALALPAEQRFPAGLRQVVTATFSVASNATGTTMVGFGDDPTRREVADINANALPCNFTAGTITLAQNNPTPSIVNLDPANRDAGSGAFTLTVNGANFVNGAVVRWNAGDRQTSFVNSSRLQAAIPAADIANAGAANITVFNPAPGGGLSNTLVFTINPVQTNPLPVLTSLDPPSRAAGGAGFTLMLNGAGFLNSSSVRWNGADRLTSFVNATRLTIEVAAGELAAPGSVALTVFNPAPGGGLSNALTFTITQPPNPVPSITSLNPAAAIAGSGALTLTVTGTNFVNGAVVRWNGADRATTFGSATQLTAAIPASNLVNAGSANVAVFNPASTGGGGGLSNALTFTINQPPNPVPSITSLNPNATIAGSSALTLTVNGSSFVNGAVVRWNGADRATTFVNATQLTAALPASDLANVGAASVTVFNPANVSGGGGTSNALTFTINPQPNPTPSLAALNPSQATAGGGSFTLTVSGASFVNGAVVRWNGADRATTFNSSAQLTATIPASDIANAGAASVTVFNPANTSGGGGASNALSFTINNPAPSLNSLTPNAALAHSAAFSLTVNGAGFVAGSTVRWNGANRPTAFVSAAQLIAQIPASDLASTGAASITVLNPAPGGGVSNAVSFTINPVAPAPTLTGLIPTTINAGSGAFTLTVNGAGFVATSLVRWNGADRATTFINSTQLAAQITAADSASAGMATVTVFTPAPGGGASNALPFTINPQPNPAPALASLTPSTIVAGSGAFTLTVSGTNFVGASVVRWNGADRPTTLVSGALLTAQIPASDIANAGMAQITVFNPAPGGGASNALPFTITQLPNPAPTLSSLSPNQATAGGAAFTLTVNGASFVNGAQVRWNGADRATTFVSGAQLTAAILASDIANAGAATVTVLNPASSGGGGGASNALSFTINPRPNPAPSIASLDPAFAIAGRPAFVLTVNGANFVNGSLVRWNGAERQTTFLSATQLRANIHAADIASAGAINVTVFNPAPGGGISAAQSFPIANPLANVSAASFRANELAAESIVAAFGTNLATGIEVASGLPLPTTLRGTSVRVRDSAGTERLAPLFFVAPTQINYLMPQGTATGTATVFVTSGANELSVNAVTIANVAPGIFTANSSGQGVAGGLALRVKADGSQVFEPLAMVGPSGQMIAAPIDLGPEGEQVFLLLFGTGFRGRGAQTAASATIGGVNAEVLFAGAQGILAGLDQANLRIPRSLAGRGEVEVVLTVEGKSANPVRIAVK
jgi:uncharacterized protein (TIGR03437 family)